MRCLRVGCLRPMAAGDCRVWSYRGAVRVVAIGRRLLRNQPIALRIGAALKTKQVVALRK